MTEQNFSHVPLLHIDCHASLFTETQPTDVPASKDEFSQFQGSLLICWKISSVCRVTPLFNDEVLSNDILLELISKQTIS